MKTLFLEARHKEKIKIPQKEMEKLPKKICLSTTVQYMDSIDVIREDIEGTGRKVMFFKGRHTKYPGQILGCEIEGPANDCDAHLYIGDGRFHPLALKLKSDKQVFAYNPLTKKMVEIKDSDIERWKKKQRAGIVKYHSSKNIGILVSTKPGQNRMKQALELKKKKNAFIFICDTLDFSELENFPFIDVWVNTMCPRIAFDDSDKFNRPVVNIDDVLD